MIKNFKIQNYKNLENLSIENLGQFNLLVGNNNTGKSNILEALLLYFNKFSLDSIQTILDNRNEDISCFHGDGKTEEELIKTLGPLCPDRNYNSLKQAANNSIVIGTDNDYLQIALIHAVSRQIQLGQHTITQMAPYSQKGSSSLEEVRPAILSRTSRTDNTTFKTLSRTAFSTISSLVWLDRSNFARGVMLPPTPRCPIVFLSCKAIDANLFEKNWSKISMTPEEAEFFNVLQKIYPAIDKVNLLKMPDGRDVPFVALKNGVRMPLSELGDGMTHVANILIALVGAQNGVLLLDELESGLHVSTLRIIWKSIFDIATRLNVQVFATTHSIDCIRAFTDYNIEKKNMGSIYKLGWENNVLGITMYNDPNVVDDLLAAGVDIR